MPAGIIADVKSKMEKCVQHFHDELNAVRTGKANPALVEGLMVDYYGTATRLKELAGITTPEPRMILIQPWDASAVNAISTGIQKSDIGVMPIVDGKMIRIQIPELSEERRKDLGRMVKKLAEENRVAVRNIRREANDLAKKQKKDGDITEDEFHRLEEQVQKETDHSIKKIDQLLSDKEEDLKKI